MTATSINIVSVERRCPSILEVIGGTTTKQQPNHRAVLKECKGLTSMMQMMAGLNPNVPEQSGSMQWVAVKIQQDCTKSPSRL